MPVALLPYIALVLLSLTFVLTFYFSTYVAADYAWCTSDSILYRLPKDNVPIRETTVATTASLLGGFGVVALFCTMGVYV